MSPRISDLRVHQAQQHGVIVGLPNLFVEEVAALADFLLDCHLWSDVTLLFAQDIVAHSPTAWRIAVEGRWWLMFDWAKSLGPVDLRLWHEDDD